ncbi:hypothetical protein J0H58_36505 [bacterium]|nr:hypothetical protein [bacterium]
MSGAGLSHLGMMPRLRRLDLSGTEGPTAAGLPGFGCVREVILRECGWVTDAGLAAVADLPHLRRLDLRGCSVVTDAGVAHLARAA